MMEVTWRWVRSGGDLERGVSDEDDGQGLVMEVTWRQG